MSKPRKLNTNQIVRHAGRNGYLLRRAQGDRYFLVREGRSHGTALGGRNGIPLEAISAWLEEIDVWPAA